MEEENIETIDSTNDETEETVETLKAKYEAEKSKNQGLYERAKKAEGFERDENGKWVKHEAEPTPKESPKPTAKKSGELDYGQKAFLVANGIKGEKEFALVKEAMTQSGKSLENILESKWFQSELEESRAITKTENATPKSTRTGNSPNDDVDYWMSKPIEEVPQHLRIKVVNKRLENERGGSGFYNSK